MKAALCYWGKTVTFKAYLVMIPHYGEMGLTSQQKMLAIYQLLLAADYQQKVNVFPLQRSSFGIQNGFQ
ncbi:MAG: hypothetical protein ACRBFS_08575 [Aureispira sp.]